MNLQDWASADHFPQMSSSHKIATVAFGLPKHSQPDSLTRVKRMNHMKLPPVVAPDGNSISVSNLPLRFSWMCNDQGQDTRIRSPDQILSVLKPPW